MLQINRTDGATHTVGYEYDLAGRRVRMTWPDSFFALYTYNAANDVTSIRANGAASGPGVLALYEYDNLGRRTEITRGNGVVTNYTYDAASRLAELQQNLAGASDDLTLGFSYNAAGQVLDRTGMTGAYAWPQPAVAAEAYAANGRNQYTNVGAASFTYDARGNLIATGAANYGYDAFNRLTSAGSATLSYDPAGRLYEVDGASTTRFLYDGLDLIAEYDDDNELLRRYVHGPAFDEPIVWYEGDDSSDRRWLVADQLGSIVALTDVDGELIGTPNTYDEYGRPGASNAGRFQFTGQMWIPEANFYHYKTRAYAPTIGRFLQTDPILYAGGMNLYAYVGNDPVNAIDPLGLTVVVPGRRPTWGGTIAHNCTDEAPCDPGDWVSGPSIFPPGAGEPRDEDTIIVIGRRCPRGRTCYDDAQFLQISNGPIIPFKVCWSAEVEVSIGAGAGVEGALGPVHGGGSADILSLRRRLEWNQWTTLFEPQSEWTLHQGFGADITVFGAHGSLGAERTTTGPGGDLGPWEGYGEPRVGFGGGAQLGIGLEGFIGLKFGDACDGQLSD